MRGVRFHRRRLKSRRLNRFRRLSIFYVDLSNQDARAVSLHIALCTFTNFCSHLGTALGQHLIHGGTTDNMANC